MKKRIHSSRKSNGFRPNISFRAIWYLVLTWVFGFIIGSTIVLPWFYIILPLVVLLLAVYYLDRPTITVSKKDLRDEIFKAGLALSVVWFLGALIYSTFIVWEFYYFNFNLFFSDSRNWFMPAVFLIIPIVYSVVLANIKGRKRRKRMPKLGKNRLKEALN